MNESFNKHNNRSSFPDLFLFQEGNPLLVEVKNKHEEIAEH